MRGPRQKLFCVLEVSHVVIHLRMLDCIPYIMNLSSNLLCATELNALEKSTAINQLGNENPLLLECRQQGALVGYYRKNQV